MELPVEQIRGLTKSTAKHLAFDSKLESWEAGWVKMTFDLPEDLLREAKIRAIQEGKTFKDKMAELFALGLDMMDAAEMAGTPGPVIAKKKRKR